LLPAGMEITSYNHHCEGSFLPSVFVLKPRLPGFESSLRSYPIIDKHPIIIIAKAPFFPASSSSNQDYRVSNRAFVLIQSTFRDFRKVGTTDEANHETWPARNWAAHGRSALGCSDAHEVEVRGAHPSKNAKGEAADVVVMQRWTSPHHGGARKQQVPPLRRPLRLRSGSGLRSE